jgi:hypothetical protein
MVAVVAFPILSTVLALMCAIVIGRDALRRPRPDKVIWAIAFVMFALAAGADAAGRELGWSTALAKLYYATGPALVVMYLAIGELYLLFPARMRRFGTGLTLIATAFWASLVLGAPIDEARLAADGWEAIERDGFMTAVTIAINSIGTLIIVGGTGYTVWTFARRRIMRNRMIGCALILVGTLAVAAGGSLTRLGHYEYLYIAMSIGIALIFAGVLWTRRPERVMATTPVEDVASARIAPVAPAAGTPAPTAEPALAFAIDLLERDATDLARTCAEWSVPAQQDPAFSRAEARTAWALRLALPPASQQRFDALPVPARRQLATLYSEVLAWSGARPPAPEPSGMPERPLRIEQKAAGQ